MSQGVVAIIQARLGSSRFPGKVLAEVSGRPVIDHVVTRTGLAQSVDHVVIATSTEPQDDELAEYASRQGWDVYRGSEEDVLDRYYQAAVDRHARHIVRITADCPLTCPDLIDRVVDRYLETGAEYCTNTLTPTYPDGCDVEVFGMEALARAWSEATDPMSREHVTPYLRDGDRFSVCNVESPVPVSTHEYHWSVDRPDDVHTIERIHRFLRELGSDPNTFAYSDLLAVVEGHSSEVCTAGSSVVGEGYYRGLLAVDPVPPTPRSFARSDAQWRAGAELIPGCSQTFSKGPDQFVRGASPVYVERGQGAHVWDVDGNEYVDCGMGLGSVLLGHGDESVGNAVAAAVTAGTSHSLPHTTEIELAELLREVVPCAEMVRFGKNGSDATSGAVRAARAITGRDVVACCGYHGWQDWYIGTTTRSAGVPQPVRDLTVPFPYDDVAALERLVAEHDGQIACVIMEPVGLLEPAPGYLEAVRDITHAAGALLIFDEVVTGFRLALGGAQEHFSITPDLACLGKGMANGFPISAVVGSAEYMRIFEEVFFSFTFGGETASIAAAITTIRTMRERGFYEHLWHQGGRLRDGFNVMAEEIGVSEVVSCVGYAPRTGIAIAQEDPSQALAIRTLLEQEFIKRGVISALGHNVSLSHGDSEIDHLLRVFASVLPVLHEALESGTLVSMLDGPVVEPVFRRP